MFRMNRKEFQGLLQIAKEQVPIGIYAVEKADYAELRRDKCESITKLVQSAALDKAYKVLIYVPKGSCCAYIEKISKYPKQRELLLDKNTIFRVISKKKNSIELQVIV